MEDGDRAGGRDLSFFFSSSFFFLSHKMGRREGGERPAAGDPAARAGARAPRRGRAVGWAPRGARVCAGRGPRRRGQVRAQDGPRGPVAPVTARATICLLSHLRRGFMAPGGAEWVPTNPDEL